MGRDKASASGLAVEIVLLVFVEYIFLIFFSFSVFSKSIALCSPSRVSGGSVLTVNDFSA
jgi:hypothetical protein